MLSELRALEKRVTVSELARYIGLTQKAIQRLADDMANDGLVKFAENPGDARAIHLLVTEAGKATYADALEREWQWTNVIAGSGFGIISLCDAISKADPTPRSSSAHAGGKLQCDYGSRSGRL